jgi:hypothetical protein
MPIFLTIVLSLTLLGRGSLDATEEIKFHSQACQDEFVYTMLYVLINKQDPGYYLEIGAGDPININNTYVFEKTCGWQGLSIDIADHLGPRWHAMRRNPLLLTDATQLDYSSVLETFPQVIDYLSLDIDCYYDLALKKILRSNRIFKIITIEHDAYRFGDIFRSRERSILREHGYHLLCADVSLGGSFFEDWWIHPSFFAPSLLQQLSSLNLHSTDCVEILKRIKGSGLVQAKAS